MAGVAITVGNYLTFPAQQQTVRLNGGLAILVGPNGCGKTNLFRAVVKMVRSLSQSNAPNDIDGMTVYIEFNSSPCLSNLSENLSSEIGPGVDATIQMLKIGYCAGKPTLSFQARIGGTQVSVANCFSAPTEEENENFRLWSRVSAENIFHNFSLYTRRTWLPATICLLPEDRGAWFSPAQEISQIWLTIQKAFNLLVHHRKQANAGFQKSGEKVRAFSKHVKQIVDLDLDFGFSVTMAMDVLGPKLEKFDAMSIVRANPSKLHLGLYRFISDVQEKGPYMNAKSIYARFKAIFKTLSAQEQDELRALISQTFGVTIASADMFEDPAEGDIQLPENIPTADLPVFKKGNATFDLRQLPGATLELIFLLSAIHLSEDYLVLLDEPGAHFHPHNQIRLRDMLREAAATGKKAFVWITHSPELIGLDSVQSVVCCRAGQSGTVMSPSMVGQLSQHVISLLFEPNMRSLIFAQKILFVEGHADHFLLSALMESIAAPKFETFRSQNRIEPHSLRDWAVVALNSKDIAESALKAVKFLGKEYKFLLDRDAAHRHDPAYAAYGGFTEEMAAASVVAKLAQIQGLESEFLKFIMDDHDRLQLQQATRELESAEAKKKHGSASDAEVKAALDKLCKAVTSVGYDTILGWAKKQGIFLWPNGSLESVVAADPALTRKLYLEVAKICGWDENAATDAVIKAWALKKKRGLHDDWRHISFNTLLHAVETLVEKKEIIDFFSFLQN
eukprot:TRINITY_DN1655_c0_g2_i2.p1 TRINITY_DN1655_c0_g2~~TRINITY_DN1655_c0_g2_i2.p1  ORF type:complete len:734 (+),score=96.03 TRINITY_DN1655_c0_g2_i2:504-2705(+)